MSAGFEPLVRTRRADRTAAAPAGQSAAGPGCVAETLTVVTVAATAPAKPDMPNLPTMRSAASRRGWLHRPPCHRRRRWRAGVTSRRQDAAAPRAGRSLDPHHRMDSVPHMSLTSPRRDQRRRLLVAWTRSADDTSAAVSDHVSPAASSVAVDGVQPTGLAALVPVGWVRFGLAALACVAPAAASATLAVWETATGRPFAAAEGRFAATLQVLRSAFDPTSVLSVPEWIAHASLWVSAAFAVAVRSLARQRRDDYVGRHRAWGWLAGLFVVTSFAASAPLGQVVSAALGDATGMRPGPGGIGWWVGIATTMLITTVLWAVLPLRERSTTFAWSATAALSWSGAVVGAWLTASGTMVWTHQVLAARIAWWAGCSLALVSMLAATRAVLREIRGLVAPRQSGAERRGRREQKAAARAQRPVRVDDEVVTTPGTEEADESGAESTNTSGAEPMFVSDDMEDDEADMRHLSKSERKRLRKLRKQRAAA